ncbi:MAG TPA: HepT-like ribonuclease domain-containing protein [Tepidisphaeraceae bacterium]|nr:HepT-like ribonuclease domain-containing protein [Tepidisphaeraceae bacterium]
MTEAYQQQHPEIPWSMIMGQRHVLAHDYGEIKHERIWLVATVHVPVLIEQLKGLVPPPPQESGG